MSKETEEKKEEPLKVIKWDTNQIVKDTVQRLMEEDKATGGGAYESEEEALESVYGDEILFEMEYDNLCEDLKDSLDEFNPDDKPYLVTVEGFGWRNMSGYSVIPDKVTATELLSKILPNTDCRFNIFVYPDRISIQNFHHDSPTGNEWYRIVTVDRCEICGEPFVAGGEDGTAEVLDRCPGGVDNS